MEIMREKSGARENGGSKRVVGLRGWSER
jgi:hypothetical protein